MVTGHFVHPWHFVHPDIWSTWTFGLKTTRTPWHIVPRQLVYPDILSKDNSYTLTFHTPYFVMSWLKYQRVYQMSWTFGTPFSYRFLTERVYQMSWTFGTPFPCSLLAPDIWYTLTFGTPWQVVQYHLVHPDISYTLLPVRKGCTRCHGHLVHPFSKKPIRKGCTKCPWHLVHPFSNTPTGKGVPNVWVYQMSNLT